MLTKGFVTFFKISQPAKTSEKCVSTQTYLWVSLHKYDTHQPYRLLISENIMHTPWCYLLKCLIFSLKMTLWFLTFCQLLISHSHPMKAINFWIFSDIEIMILWNHLWQYMKMDKEIGTSFLWCFLDRLVGGKFFYQLLMITLYISQRMSLWIKAVF